MDRTRLSQIKAELAQLESQEQEQQQQQENKSPVERQQQQREAHRQQQQNIPPKHEHNTPPTTPDVTIPGTEEFYHVRKRGGRIVTRKGKAPEKKGLFSRKKVEAK